MYIYREIDKYIIYIYIYNIIYIYQVYKSIYNYMNKVFVKGSISKRKKMSFLFISLPLDYQMDYYEV